MIDRDVLDGLRREVDRTRGELPAGLCRDVADLLGVTDVTLALIGGPARRLTLCASSERALTLDHWQFTLDEGPCLDAATTGRAASGGTTGDDVAWPQLGERAFDLGYEHIGGLPLAVSGRIYGAMNLQNSGAFPKELMEDAGEVAEVLSGPIMSQLAERAPATVDLADYAVVHQASGMISAQMGIPIEDALAVLRARAWTEGRLLVHIATEVVEREIQFDDLNET